MELIQRFIAEEEGADAVEYALVIALIALAIVGGAAFLGSEINAKLSAVGSAVCTAGGPGC